MNVYKINSHTCQPSDSCVDLITNFTGVTIFCIFRIINIVSRFFNTDKTVIGKTIGLKTKKKQIERKNNWNIMITCTYKVKINNYPSTFFC